MKPNLFKKAMVLLLSFALVFTMMPAAAFAQESQVSSIEGEVTDVATAAELETALNDGKENIRITSDFSVDRTFFITKDVIIFTEEAHTLTRAADFAGDIFVVGEAADKTATEAEVSLTLGNPLSDQENLLIIDGNKENMTVDVTGTVVFVCSNGYAKLYDNLTVINHKKMGNVRTLEEAHGLSYQERIGGPVMILASNSRADIYGGIYSFNSGNDTDGANVSDWGGAIYAFAQLNVYGGTFEGNQALRGGAFYLYRAAHIYNALIKDNYASTYGGAIYQPGSTAAKLYLGEANDIVESSVTFEGNTSESGAGAIYSSMLLDVKNTTFKNNKTAENGGAIRISGAKDTNIENSVFTGNEATENGGAIYSSKTAILAEDSQFDGNKAGNGGAVYATGQSTNADVDLFAKNVKFDKNSTTAHGGAIFMTSGARAYLKKTEMTGNSAATNGGAIYNSASFLEMNVAKFDKNTGKVGAAIELLAAGEAVLNKVTATENVASGNGGFVHADGASKVDVYNSTFKKNQGSSGGVAYFYTDVVANIYNSYFEGNIGTTHAGVFCIYTYDGNVIVQDCEFKNNSSANYGGVAQISGQSEVQFYNNKATGNSADKGGFLYITTAGTVVDLVGVEVSGNTASTGGPIIWGNTINAKLFINKSLYKDLDVAGELDDAYWSTLVANKLTTDYSTTTIPTYVEYEQPEFDTDYPSEVMSPLQLYNAINAGYSEITLGKSFEVDRTYYITKDVVIKSNGDYKITRAAGFDGDIFVVGEDKDGKACTEEATLTLGAADDENEIVIDGNASKMTVDVKGTVFFVGESGSVKLHNNVTVKNNAKKANDRVLNEAYELANAEKIGGSVAIILGGGSMDIAGSEISNNAVNNAADATASIYGGAIYNEGTLTVTGATFDDNGAARGGAIYSKDAKMTISGTDFAGNDAEGDGGAIYISGKCPDKVKFDVNMDNCSFDGNTSQAQGGALYLSNGARVKLAEIDFNKNIAKTKGGAIMNEGGVLDMDGAEIKENEAENGGAIATLASGKTTINNVNASGNKASVSGGFAYTQQAELVTYSSVIEANSAPKGGAVALEDGATATLNDSEFKSNTASENGGALFVSTKGTKAVTHNCTFEGNSATNAGGAAYAEDSSLLEMYDSVASANSADKGGVVYFTSTGTNVTINGITVTDNTATSGPVVYGEGTDSQLTINKSNYEDTAYDSEPDDAYWANAVVNQGISNETDAAAPNYPTYGNESSGDMYDAEDVTSAAELEAALLAGHKHIRVVADFEIDRTFYIAYDVTIFSTKEHKLTREKGFAGDIFVVGEISDGVACEADVTLTLGNPSSKTADLLTIDGNKENMEVGVNGTVVFICGNGHANIYENVTFANHKKTGNERTTREGNTYGLSYPDSVGGPAIILAKSATLDVFGGTFINNEVNTKSETDTSIWGGAIYGFGNINIYGGLFENNQANRAGAIYSYRVTNIFNAEFKDNVASTYGGAIYVPASTGSFLYLGGENDVAESKVLFSGNSANSGAGAVYCTAKMGITDTVFEKNSTGGSGGAIRMSGNAVVDIADSKFDRNSAKETGGAIYNSGAAVTINDTEFSGNSATESGGAIITRAKSANAEIIDIFMKNVSFKDNTSDAAGGAVYVEAGNRAYISKAEFEGNIADGNGGAIAANGAEIEVNIATIKKNDGNLGGAIYLEESAKGVFNKITATENTGSAGGFGYVATSADMKLYDSTVQNNSASAGGAMRFQASGTASIYDTDFIGNESTNGNGGALYVYTGGSEVVFNKCTFDGNTSSKYGGVAYMSNKSVATFYDSVFKNNKATHGGFIYQTTATTTLNLIDAEVSGNTATTKGPFFYGVYDTVVVNLNKALFTDADLASDGVQDDAYWKAMFYNKCTLNEVATVAPTYLDYVQPMFDHDVPAEVENAGQLYRALLEGHKEIKLLNDIQVNRTLYVTEDTVIYSDSDCTITRAHDFGGDLFVVGEDSQGNAVSKGADLTLGKDGNNALLIIDGNEANMTVDVTGRVFRVVGASELNILAQAEINNNKLMASDGIGGSVALIGEDGKMSVAHAEFNNNIAEGAKGGAIYNEGTLEVKGSFFTGNKAEMGGAVYSTGSFEAADTALSFNEAVQGGALAGKGAMELDSCTFDGNNAVTGGAVAVEEGSKLLINGGYASTNTATEKGGFLYADGADVIFCGGIITANTAADGGAVAAVNGTTVKANDTTFASNSATNAGGVVYAADNCVVEMYEVIAKENTAVQGGVIYVAATGVNLTLYGMTVSSNEGEGHLAYAAVEGTTLKLNKETYKDQNTSDLNEEYWKAAIVNIGYEEFSLDNVNTAAELEAALKAGLKNIRINSSFEIDRTFYITKDVNIFSTKPCTLTRAADFGGDIFVVGEDASGKTPLINIGRVEMQLGKADSDSENLLIIDGNKDNMTVDVTGTVLFICYGSEVELYDNVTIQNCHKVGNVKAKESKYYIKSLNRTGGAMAIIGDGTLYIYGGNYKDNSSIVNATKESSYDSSYGGAIYNISNLKMYGGTFKDNDAYIGGAIYNRGVIYLYSGTFDGNHAKSSAGAVYNYNSARTHTFIGDYVDKSQSVMFKNNSADSNGGAIYSGTLAALIIDNSTFEGNVSGSNGGAICAYGTLTSRNNTFERNDADYRGGAVYISYSDKDSDTRFMDFTNCKFIENEGTLGGALSAYCGSTDFPNGVISNIKNCEFTGNKAVKQKETSTVAYGGAIYTDRMAKITVTDSTFTGNSADYNGGGAYFGGASKITLKKVAFDGNSSLKGGAIYTSNSTVELRESDVINNNANEGAGVYLYAGGKNKIYKTDFENNTATHRGGGLFCYTTDGTALVHSCNFKNNSATNYGGAVLASGKCNLTMHNTVATGNASKLGGFLYETTEGTIVTLVKLTLSGNTGSDGPIIRGNNAGAVLNVNKSLVTDSDYGKTDTNYWKTFVAGALNVKDISTSVSTYEKATTVKKSSAVDVDKIFALGKKSSNASINSKYDKLPKLSNKSNFMSKGTTKFKNINGKTVTVDTFIYPTKGKADSMNFGLGTLIYQAMLYKKANPKEKVTIDTTSYRFSVQSAVNINRNSRYFGYMRDLSNNKNYDEYGFVRISYLLTCAAAMGIEVTVVGNLDGYPVGSNDMDMKEYFAAQMNRPCDSTYVKNKKVSDFLNFQFCDWTLHEKGGTDMMHTKMAAVSHYLDKDGKAHKNAIYTSSSNMDGIKSDGQNGNWKQQTGTIITNHDELYKVTKNYLRLIAGMCRQEEVYDFQKIVNTRSTEQIDLLTEGRGSEIPSDEQIVYIGTSKDKVFELYFTPFAGSRVTWDEKYNPYSKYLRELVNSDDYILFTWNSAEYSAGFPLGREVEAAIIEAFHKNKDPRNKIYMNCEKFDSSTFDDLKVGRDIGYKSFNQYDFGKIHNKDLQFSYSKNGKRQNVTMHNSLNFHSGSASYQSNFVLIIKETSCSPKSVFGIFSKYTTKGNILGHTYGEAKPSGATAEKHGTLYCTCVNCGYKQKAGTAHYASDWIVDKKATVWEDGTRHKECTVCEKVLQKETYAFTINPARLEGKTFTSSTNETTGTLTEAPKTIEAIINIPTKYASAAGIILGNFADADGNQMNLYVTDDGKLQLYLKEGSITTTYDFATDLRSSGQTHIALTFEGSVVNLYVSGVLKETLQLAAVPDFGASFKIGGDNRSASSSYFKGTIYAVNMFSDVRTAEEIAKDAMLVVGDAGNLIYSKYYDTKTTAVPEAAALSGKTFSKSKKISLNTLSKTPRTIEAIVKLPKKVKGRGGVIVGNYNGSGTDLNLEIGTYGRPKLYFNTGKAKVTVQFSTDIRTDSGSKHIAVSVSGKKAYLFVDGVKKETKTIKYKLPSGIVKGFKIGGDNRSGNKQYFKGTIYAVNMFSDVRSSDEIKYDSRVVTTSAASQVYTGYFSASNVATGAGKVMVAEQTFSKDKTYSIGNVSATPKTIEATIKLSKDINDRGGVIVGNYDGSGKEMNLEIGTKGRPKLFFNTGKAKVTVQFSTDIRTKKAARHVAVTVSGKKATLYVDGVKKETKTMKYSLPSGITKGFKVGGDNRSGNTQYFKGTIYAVNMFSDVRTSGEIKNDAKLVTSKSSKVIYTGYFAKAVCNITSVKEAHTSGGYVVDFPATAEESGVCHSECTTCGKILDIKKTSETA